MSASEPISAPIEPLATWSPRAKLIVSALVMFHLLGVFLAPLWFASGQQSPLIAPLMVAYRPYINTLYLNHGYAFFAPNPGSSHLVRYRLEFANGRQPEEGVFPNLQEERPRLLYHRHFMLSESLFTYSNFPPLPPTATESERAEHAARRQAYFALKRSFQQHLAAAHHAEQVELRRLEHRPLFVDEVARDGKRLDADETYRDLDAPPPLESADPLPLPRTRVVP
ncbi:MAG TPA: hypothetical protein VL096_10385 [Pirellulaceae bacterium]|nr:hypothetical protein [Pirellulaceae bacterium]